MNELPLNFEDILDRCILDMRDLGMSAEDCLNRYPSDKERLAPILSLVTRLQEGKNLKTRQEFRQVAVRRMDNLIAARAAELNRSYGKITRQNPKRSMHSFVWPRRQFAVGTVIITILLLFVFTSGVVYASSSALPGESFYPIKKGIENIQLAFSTADSQNVRLHLKFASRRLDEITRIISKEQLEHLNQGVTDYTDQIEAALVALAVKNKNSDQEQSKLASLMVTTLDQNENRLNILLSSLPAGNQRAIQSALEISRNGRNQAMDVIRSLPGGSGGLPGLLATSSVIQADATPTAYETPASPSEPAIVPSAWPSIYPATSELKTTATPGNGTATPGGGGIGTQTPPALSTGWPTYYPTYKPTYSSDWSTVYPTPRKTPRPHIRPTLSPAPVD